MSEKNTNELKEILGKTHLSEFEKYCKDNKESINDKEEAFSIYIKDLLANKGMIVKSEKVCKLFSVENDIKLPSSWPSF